MMNNLDAFALADSNERHYADLFTRTSDILAEHEVYEQMGAYFAMSTVGLRKEYGVPADRPLVHIDIGSGAGYALQEMDKVLRDANEEAGIENANHLLIGIDINTYMCRKAVESLLQNGSTVVHHIAYDRSFIETEAGPVLQRTFPVHHNTLESMNMTPDGRIMILQDDILKDDSVLSAVLSQLRRRYGISHVDSVSFAQPGLAVENIFVGKSLSEIAELDGNKERQASFLPGYLASLTDTVTQKAKQLLGYGDSLVTVHRLINGEGLAAAYTSLSGLDFPQNEFEQSTAQLQVATLALGKDAFDFRPKLGAVLYPNYQDVQKLTPIEYTGIKHIQERVPNLASYDLFALTSLRADLHPMRDVKISRQDIRVPGTDSKE